MGIDFIGRTEELAALERVYQGGKTAMVPVYGRRRVGKSQLILEFLRNKPSLYYLGNQTSAPLQQREFLRRAADALDTPLLASLAATTWREVLRHVTDCIQARREDTLFVIALDEFQWMVEDSSELPSLLQELLDMDWKNAGNIMLILCGSFIGFMEREVLGRKSPLFGRRAAQILLQPFGYRDAAEFHPAWSIEDQAKAYFVCGGVPFYHLFFDAKRPFTSQLQHLFFESASPLHREADFLLREEFREVRRYYAILTAIGTRSMPGRDIAKITGIEERKLTYYIDRLIDLGYIGRRRPLVPDKRNRPGRVRYEISDALLSFWFRFVSPNTTYIAEMGGKDSMQNLVKPNLDAWFGKRFEHLCREALPLFYKDEGITTPFEIGEYWDKTTQIDVVGVREKEGIDLGECKWGRVTSATKLRRELDAKRAAYPDGGLSVRPWIFTRLPFRGRSQPVAGEQWVSLDQLYSI